ncbi:MAG: kdgA1 [Acidimicrobiaceae bacterium]|jgi:2-dehydro-3-deoxyphosphogluconate aldolase/(4S)-4-hydroxy-2-oxoglutarate aldolase|nr:kdgA1 [Acidimicrobiaceae bacterium]
MNEVPSGLIAVVRAASGAECRTIVRGLADAGVEAIEITMTVPGAVSVLAELAGMTATIGAGTVLDVEACRACADAGAAFIVSPVTDEPVLDVAHANGIPYIAGALSPNEVVAGLRLGVDATKLFPVGSMGGPAYLRALREPLPEIKAVVSGGIGVTDVESYVAVGAHAICMGGALIDRSAARAGDVDAVAAHARKILEVVNAALA